MRQPSFSNHHTYHQFARVSAFKSPSTSVVTQKNSNPLHIKRDFTFGLYEFSLLSNALQVSLLFYRLVKRRLEDAREQSVAINMKREAFTDNSLYSPTINAIKSVFYMNSGLYTRLPYLLQKIELNNPKIRLILAVFAKLASKEKIEVIECTEQNYLEEKTIAYFNLETRRIIIRPDCTPANLIHEITHAIDNKIQPLSKQTRVFLKITPFSWLTNEAHRALYSAYEKDMYLFKQYKSHPVNNETQEEVYERIINDIKLVELYPRHERLLELKSYYIELLVDYPEKEVERALPNLTKWFDEMFFPLCQNYLNEGNQPKFPQIKGMKDEDKMEELLNPTTFRS